MRIAVFAFLAVMLAGPLSAQDDGFDDRGYDRNDRTPDWNYRRGESQAKGAYYDGGRYGPRGLSGTGAGALDPWLADTVDGALAETRSGRDDGTKKGAASKANRWFRVYADADGDLRLTDEEIETALVAIGKSARR